MSKDAKVPRRPLSPESSVTVPIIGLGCSSFSTFFWHKHEHDGEWTPETMDRKHPRVQEWIATINIAIQSGINLLDTAPWYGHGTSEVVIGWALEDFKGDRKDLIINTKVGRYEADPCNQFNFTKDATLASVERSLKRMNCKYIDVLQLHDPEFAPSLEILLDETIPAMMECRERGWCNALGLTGYPLAVQHQIFQASTERYGKNVWDQSLTYGHYNLHDSSLVSPPPSFLKNQSFADYCQSNKIALLAAAPLSMGLLTHAGPPEWHPASDELKQACRKAVKICETHNVNISTLAILYALSNPSKIPCTLLGMKNIEQVMFAVHVASRFVKLESSSEDPTEILKEVLTKAEYKVYELLVDPEEGPFASVWKSGKSTWDGVEQARNFWKQVNGVKIPSWQATRSISD